jgi:hypothetical protein
MNREDLNVKKKKRKKRQRLVCNVHLKIYEVLELQAPARQRGRFELAVPRQNYLCMARVHKSNSLPSMLPL